MKRIDFGALIKGLAVPLRFTFKAELSVVELTPNPDQLLNDFATIFAHMWYRDFPVHHSFRSLAQRADWTTHIGIAVRSTADLIGLFTHFESGGRTDAELKNNQGECLASLEWEWNRLDKGDEIVNEFKKLRERCEKASIKFGCLIGYARDTSPTEDRKHYSELTEKVLEKYRKDWTQRLPPLLLVIIHFVLEHDQRVFKEMTFHKLQQGEFATIRTQPAHPWDASWSRWAYEKQKPSGT